MTTVAHDPLVGIKAKIERTKKHVADLDAAVREFLATNPYKVRTKRDPDTRKPIYYVAHIDDVPTCIIPQIVADAIGNMISILDHLAYRLFLRSGGTGAGRNIYFPISKDASNPTEHEAECKRKVKGMAKPTIDALLATQAYQGGKGHQLWTLNELNNLAKHRDLITVGSQFRSVDLGAYMMALARKNLGDAIKDIPDLPAFYKPADPLCPLKIGDELLIGAPNEEFNEKMDFRFEVAINEPQIIKAKPLIETVHHFSNLVDGIVSQFAPSL